MRFFAFSLWIVGLTIALARTPQGGQSTVIRHGATLPTVCALNQDVFIRDGEGFYWCSAANTWSPVGVADGFVGMIESGTCPAGWTELSSIDGRLPIATLASHANVGTTGGADNITPTGTNAAITAGTPAGTVAAPVLTGTPAVLTGTVGAIAATATSGEVTISAAGQDTAAQNHTHPAPSLTMNSYTPAGTNSAPAFTGSALATHNHTFTGTQFDNRSAFMRMIFCKKS